MIDQEVSWFKCFGVSTGVGIINIELPPNWLVSWTPVSSLLPYLLRRRNSPPHPTYQEGRWHHWMHNVSCVTFWL